MKRFSNILVFTLLIAVIFPLRSCASNRPLLEDEVGVETIVDVLDSDSPNDSSEVPEQIPEEIYDKISEQISEQFSELQQKLQESSKVDNQQYSQQIAQHNPQALYPGIYPQQPAPQIIYQQQPAPQVYQQPAQQIIYQQQPVPQVIYQQPAAPVIYQQPAPQIYQQPAPPVYQQPAPPVYQQPAPPIYREPARRAYQEPQERYQEPQERYQEVYQETEVFEASRPQIIEEEIITLSESSLLKEWNVVCGSFKLKENSNESMGFLYHAGYNPLTIYDPNLDLHRVIAASFSNKEAALRFQREFRNKYPYRADFRQAWILQLSL